MRRQKKLHEEEVQKNEGLTGMAAITQIVCSQRDDEEECNMVKLITDDSNTKKNKNKQIMSEKQENLYENTRVHMNLFLLTQPPSSNQQVS